MNKLHKFRIRSAECGIIPQSEIRNPHSERKIFTVSEITRMIKESLEQEFFSTWIVGEISNVRRPNSGHIYFTLKDENAQLNAIIFRNVADRLKFELKDGVSVIAFGSITVYEPRGQYQLQVEELEPKGIGALQLAFQQLKERLGKEGLFDLSHKKPLPALPGKIAIVTSPTGAAIRDILNVINRRFPRVEILIYPVKVQGEGAAQEIAQAIYDLNTMGDIDVMIVGRGGGSLEDLWAFNEEIVARSIYASRIPVISAVGHEIDLTISDLVADKRALTPTEAGELVVPRLDILLNGIDTIKSRLWHALVNRIGMAKSKLETIAKSYAFRYPLDKIHRLQQRLDELLQKTNTGARLSLSKGCEKLNNLASKLESMSPLKTLERGYTITTKPDSDKPLRSTEGLKQGDYIKTRFHRGTVASTITTIDNI
ncbi:MAG TPA: exodeoxyribonuclease VII large subunit [Candidatus Brocadiia bacterium]|nr:exodeoxyribonuclease VII large subunit [Planctomycetota bacterium]MBI4007298.1 exodeoxyribonuclease VII large subunit [Planctomycetota bacterium]MDO8092859.1 exodeoxyribonuclease VII large subunit [Candidatus Brocadiales bacterium]